ncbi:MAG: NUDIX domain-containing protein [Alphaproteobacteria bacterium]
MTDRLTRDDVTVIERETVYQGYFRIDRYRLRHRLHAGGWSGEVMRELFERGHAVAILLYDPARDALVMIHQFRIGALAAGLEPWLAEIVAGIVEEGETPEDVARREANEEAGCVVTDLIPACYYLVSPGGATESVHVFCGRVDSTGVGGIHGLAAEGEDIRVTVIPADEVLAMLHRGELLNSATVIAVQWFALNRDMLRQRWG